MLAGHRCTSRQMEEGLWAIFAFPVKRVGIGNKNQTAEKGVG